ncbi:MAG: DUF4258 domain-containing protein [Ferruginibacter sp.]
MTKRYLPFIVLFAAALLLYSVKKNQRGSFPHNQPADVRLPEENIDGFNRKAGTVVYSRHARCRMECRHIDESEVMEILETGVLNYDKIKEDHLGKTYPLEGLTHDKQNVRIVVAPKQNELVVVTVIDLDKDWNCDCNDP